MLTPRTYLFSKSARSASTRINLSSRCASRSRGALMSSVAAASWLCSRITRASRRSAHFVGLCGLKRHMDRHHRIGQQHLQRLAKSSVQVDRLMHPVERRCAKDLLFSVDPAIVMSECRASRRCSISVGQMENRNRLGILLPFSILETRSRRNLRSPRKIGSSTSSIVKMIKTYVTSETLWNFMLIQIVALGKLRLYHTRYQQCPRPCPQHPGFAQAA